MSEALTASRPSAPAIPTPTWAFWILDVSTHWALLCRHSWFNELQHDMTHSEGCSCWQEIAGFKVGHGIMVAQVVLCSLFFTILLWAGTQATHLINAYSPYSLQTSTNNHTENQCQSIPKWHAHVVATISNCQCQRVASSGCSTRRSSLSNMVMVKSFIWSSNLRC